MKFILVPVVLLTTSIAKLDKFLGGFLGKLLVGVTTVLMFASAFALVMRVLPGLIIALKNVVSLLTVGNILAGPAGWVNLAVAVTTGVGAVHMLGEAFDTLGGSGDNISKLEEELKGLAAAAEMAQEQAAGGGAGSGPMNVGPAAFGSQEAYKTLYQFRDTTAKTNDEKKLVLLEDIKNAIIHSPDWGLQGAAGREFGSDKKPIRHGTLRGF